MKILYYDCFSGISGDMNLGALLDLGIDEKYLIDELSKLNLNGYEIKVSRDIRKGIEGTKVDVLLQEHSHGHSHEEVSELHLHGHHHDDAHGEHNHEHIHNDNEGDHMHVHASIEHIHKDQRNLNDIEKIINLSELNSKVKELSMEIFMKVALAEAKVHGKPLYEIHFHEVGAVDSIVDIVGAAICLNYLNVDKIMSSSVELGGGFVKCAHGLIPVPAPATVEILKGIPVKLGAVPFETTTPTGAAILAANVCEFKDDNNFIINKIGYGIGNRDTEIPNVLRVMLVEEVEKVSNEEYDDVTVEQIIECNIDDMNPELYEYIIDMVFSEGALDAYITPIIMKKGRPSVKISILCEEDKTTRMKEILFRETTTLGVRSFKVDKTKLKREFIKVNTSYGEVTVKESYYKGKKIKSKFEYEECKRIAKSTGVPISEVYEKLRNEI
ncbi:nickel pincer cofactor biosynthesis protein LarC [Clostridium estertheticum]|uniref:Pyridinium-3,5-bisthiocarboxylic acid mononucleotide nickel insertion protein n=1 Tax=Clostridium estertheticum subsp. estertheticum TaxID=1552 RepID=A0A1J0GBM8_9CLOT|nr:nickel pincer cofactor biosynthesis protein LarC [Clostridium estertheticum]APC38738.1 TIGR00299 family protein [Clostridium estertheticum subsp. estertheticum]MBU3074652.1 nickel pincer cofactor biosynthesis protein LarC [Clostridium estertheticum]MBU3164636.1 nickel pincer cofactor biosynthesis protein LarC [Clostridium estertheticum]MBZ9615406.1 nickel pincer cofactor biosynthesis protein LarC [Clostridium estertheticum subsp. laramiense]WAG75292.1 nickel pincer cofactor biosynthesis pro